MPPAFLKFHWFEVSEASVSPSCEPVEEAIVNWYDGVVVPIPTKVFTPPFT